MDEKRKLIIFDRSEVFLLFIFIVLIAVTMFTLGLRIGKNISYKQEGFTDEDREKIETLKSTQEESVDEMLVKKSNGPADESKNNSYNKSLQEELGRLSKEGLKETKIEGEVAAGVSTATVSTSAVPTEVPMVPTAAPQSTPNNKTLVGKYTIQLGSHASLKEAEDFADGFAVRGYNPIISEVKIPGKGTWYRVGLGSFDSAAEAKEYIKKEESLFQGQDYIITEIK